MRAMKGSGIKAWLFYIVVRAAFALMQCFPINWNLRSARGLAWIWRRVLPRHRAIAVSHLTDAFGDERTPDEISEMADRCLESIAMFAVEAVCLTRLIVPETWPNFIRVRNLESAIDVLLSGRGAVLVTAHYGAFEMVGHLLAVQGFDLTAIMRPENNFYLNRFLVNSRRTLGLKLLDKKGASSHAEGLLQNGSMVAFIGDQDAGRKGMFVDFFGKPASTYKSIGLLAMTAEVPILVGYGRRLGDVAKYEVGIDRVILPEEWADKDDPLRWITEEYTKSFERFIREEPSQYWWVHRRWKHQPRVKGDRGGAVSEKAAR